MFVATQLTPPHPQIDHMVSLSADKESASGMGGDSGLRRSLGDSVNVFLADTITGTRM